MAGIGGVVAEPGEERQERCGHSVHRNRPLACYPFNGSEGCRVLRPDQGEQPQGMDAQRAVHAALCHGRVTSGTWTRSS